MQVELNYHIKVFSTYYAFLDRLKWEGWKVKKKKKNLGKSELLPVYGFLFYIVFFPLLILSFL